MKYQVTFFAYLIVVLYWTDVRMLPVLGSSSIRSLWGWFHTIPGIGWLLLGRWSRKEKGMSVRRVLGRMCYFWGCRKPWVVGRTACWWWALVCGRAAARLFEWRVHRMSTHYTQNREYWGSWPLQAPQSLSQPKWFVRGLSVPGPAAYS